MRLVIYGLIIYFTLLALMAVGAHHFYYWMLACSLSTLFGGAMGNLFGAVHLREVEDDRY